MKNTHGKYMFLMTALFLSMSFGMAAAEDVRMPHVTTPNVTVPTVSTPDVRTPSVNTPSISNASLQGGSALTAAQRAQSASQEMDRELQETANQLNRDLNQSFMQQKEAERLHQPRSVANRYGTEASIDQDMDIYIRQVNDELKNTWTRDEYTYQRRLLETERGAYPMDTKEYRDYSQRIDKLDNDFANRERSFIR